MKFMKLGTRPDSFYTTEDATRTLISDWPIDLIIRINNISYLLHKFPLLPKCGLLQQLCSDAGDDSGCIITLDLHDVPGGEDAFELCAKFCYGITINIGAHNFASAFCSAKFLRMTEAAEKGNFVPKLEAFFSSCILEGWKDTIATLQATAKLAEWSENLGIIRRCIDSVVAKILTPQEKVTWSFTYTRPGSEKRRHKFVPKDWWTEDISDLDTELFRCIIAAIGTSNLLPPQLIGEALHVYACRSLPDPRKSTPLENSASETKKSTQKKQRVLETVVSLIPAERGSVSIGFLLRLLSISYFLRVSQLIRRELVRRSGLQFEEATTNHLLLPSHSPSCDGHFYDIDLVGAVLESFLAQQRRQLRGERNQFVKRIRKVGKLVDSYLQVVAKDANMPVSKLVSLAEAVPEIARPDHDDLYKAINIYLKEHPNLPKDQKKQLCRVLDCQKLTPEVSAHAVRNERLPLRTVVQLLFFEQERSARAASHDIIPLVEERQHEPTHGADLNKLKLNSDVQSNEINGLRRATTPTIAVGHQHKNDELRRQVSTKIPAQRHPQQQRNRRS